VRERAGEIKFSTWQLTEKKEITSLCECTLLIYATRCQLWFANKLFRSLCSMGQKWRKRLRKQKHETKTGEESSGKCRIIFSTIHTGYTTNFCQLITMKW